MNKIKVKRGDVVEIITGNDKGKSGKILMISKDQQKVLVEGINFVKKHMPKTEENPQGGVVEREAPISISNVKSSK
tara:strand:+ start:7080 stop:7307 length:228 start_codon:yes stop_codon:yes gene_type:complete